MSDQTIDLDLAALRTAAVRAVVAAKREGHGITAGHFASFKPEVVLALLDRLEREEQKYRELMQVATAQTTTDVERSALDEVKDELQRQDAKWGEQNRPDGTGADVVPLIGVWINLPGHDTAGLEDYDADEIAHAAKQACDSAARYGKVTWRDILLEEVFEALAEEGATALRAELIQVAAVAVQWAQAIDRREAGR